MLNALSELHRKSEDSRDEQWFRRAQIAHQLGAPSGTLNPARIGVLEQLTTAGRVLKQQKPDDGRDLPLYQLPVSKKK